MSDVKKGPHDMAERWLSVAEIAGYLGVKRDTIYKWVGRKGMPAHKVGRLWKFKQDEIDGWVRSGKASELAAQAESVRVSPSP